MTVVAIYRNKEDILLPQPQQVILEDDLLILVGREEKVKNLKEWGLDIHTEKGENHLSAKGVTFAEIIPAPHSKAIGQTLKELDFRRRYGLSVVALNRMQRSYRTDVGDLELNFGDTLLVVGSSPQLGSLRRSADFIVIEPNWSDQPVNRKEAILAIIIVLAGIAASIAGSACLLGYVSFCCAGAPCRKIVHGGCLSLGGMAGCFSHCWNVCGQ